MATTSFKRLFVRNLLDTAEETGDRLCDLLKAATKARIKQTESGKVLVATTGNGHQSNWQLTDDFNPTDAVDLVSDIRDRYEEAKAKLIADGDASPTDAEIVTEILDKLRAVRSVASDFTNLRFQMEEDD